MDRVVTGAARAWVVAHAAGAPGPLLERVLAYLPEEPGAVAEALGAAGVRALRATLALGPDRPAALDLLAADALVTLALQARAQQDPAGIGAFARALRQDGATAP